MPAAALHDYVSDSQSPSLPIGPDIKPRLDSGDPATGVMGARTVLSAQRAVWFGLAGRDIDGGKATQRSCGL